MTARAQRMCPICLGSYPPETLRCPADGGTTVPVAAADPMIGAVVAGRFVIDAPLGRGGIGVVYRARQTSVARDVAIKILHPGIGDDPVITKRFVREARLASQLSNPHVVTVLDFGRAEDGRLYLAMELLRGQPLSQVLRATGPLPPERAVHIAVQVCDALEAAHAAGIVHRDLKPANIVVLDRPAGRYLLKVVDFGLAKSVGAEATRVTASGVVCGTVAYMSPEVATGEPVDGRTDLYSLGVMLYEMMTGSLPFQAATLEDTMAQVVDAPVPALRHPDAPPELAAVVARLLAKWPDERFADAARARDALMAAVPYRPVR